MPSGSAVGSSRSTHASCCGGGVRTYLRVSLPRATSLRGSLAHFSANQSELTFRERELGAPPRRSTRRRAPGRRSSPETGWIRCPILARGRAGPPLLRCPRPGKPTATGETFIRKTLRRAAAVVAATAAVAVAVAVAVIGIGTAGPRRQLPGDVRKAPCAATPRTRTRSTTRTRPTFSGATEHTTSAARPDSAGSSTTGRTPRTRTCAMAATAPTVPSTSQRGRPLRPT